jgi:hypothetical protein
VHCGIAATDPALVGEPYVDGSGNRYLPMCRQPIMVYAADRAGLRRAYERAMAREIERLAVFTHDLFATPHDQANRAAVASVPAAELDLAGDRPPCGPKDRGQSARQAQRPRLTSERMTDDFRPRSESYLSELELFRMDERPLPTRRSNR